MTSDHQISRNLKISFLLFLRHVIDSSLAFSKLFSAFYTSYITEVAIFCALFIFVLASTSSVEKIYLKFGTVVGVATAFAMTKFGVDISSQRRVTIVIQVVDQFTYTVNLRY